MSQKEINEMIHITEKQLTKIVSDHIALGEQLLAEIKSIVKEQPNQSVSVYDGDRSEMFAIIGSPFALATEEQIYRLSISDAGFLELTLANGGVVYESDVCYCTETYLDMLGVLREYVELKDEEE